MNVQGAWSVAETQENGTPATRQRPYWLIGLAMLVLVVLVLGAAFLLDQRFRPRVGTEPASGAVTTPSKTISSEAEINQLATPLQREVATAYLRYWAVYSEAVASFDTSRLGEVTAGKRLDQAVTEVANLKASGQTATVQVKHSFEILAADDSTVTVRDMYVNSSYLIDPTTRQPIGAPGESQSTVVTYTLRRIQGVWKVVEAIRES